MKRKRLRQYEDNERSFVDEVGSSAVRDGFIWDSRVIYSDLILPERLGFLRSGAPLSALSFLYPRTVVYIPAGSKKSIQRRTLLPWETLMDLSREGIVQPVIGHPVLYAGKKHFDELFEISPPSVWARGDQLARKYAGADGYWELAASVLDFEALLRSTWLKERYKRVVPHLNAEKFADYLVTELCTNFVDLCIFGYEPLAREIAMIPEPNWACQRLLGVSEMLTYPSLIGMHGTPNYGVGNPQSIYSLQTDDYIRAGDMKEIGPEAEILLSGLRLDLPNSVDVRMLHDFHVDGMSTRLWSALHELEGLVQSGGDNAAALSQSATNATTILHSTLREVRTPSFERSANLVNIRGRPLSGLTMKLCAGGVVAAGLGITGLDPTGSAIAGATVSGAWAALREVDALTARAENRVVDWLIGRKSSRFAMQLWWLDGWRSER